MNEQEILDATVFLTIGGSHAYGTNMPDSDLDTRGVCIPLNRGLYFGLNHHNFEQKEKWESGEDLCIYDFRKIVGLMLSGNPNCIELLFTPESKWKFVKTPWLKLAEHREKFLSKRMRYTFGGYAFAQLKRIKGHRGYLLNPPKKKPERSDFGLPDAMTITNDTLSAYLWTISKLLKDSVEQMNLSPETKWELSRVNYIGLTQRSLGQTEDSDTVNQALKEMTGMPDNFIEMAMREKRYAGAMKSYESFHRWKKERNPKRAVLEEKFGFDCKHAMHLVRLLRMGVEILEKGEVNVFRADRDELRQIRQGAWSYEKLESYAHEAEKKLDDLYQTSSLPHAPNTKFVDNLCTDVVESALLQQALGRAKTKEDTHDSQ